MSVGWAKKISAQRNRNGQSERVAHQPGRKWRAGAEAQRQVMDWVRLKPDLTLVQLQAKLHTEAGVSLSLGRVWHLLRKLDLRLKKSRSTPERDTEANRKRRKSSSSDRRIDLERLIFSMRAASLRR